MLNSLWLSPTHTICIPLWFGSIRSAYACVSVVLLCMHFSLLRSHIIKVNNVVCGATIRFNLTFSLSSIQGVRHLVFNQFSHAIDHDLSMNVCEYRNMLWFNRNFATRILHTYSSRNLAHEIITCSMDSIEAQTWTHTHIYTLYTTGIIPLARLIKPQTLTMENPAYRKICLFHWIILNRHAYGCHQFNEWNITQLFYYNVS